LSKKRRESRSAFLASHSSLLASYSSPLTPKKMLPETLTELKVRIKDILINDLEKALLTMKEHLQPDAEAYDETIIALERCNRINKALQKGLIPFQEADTLLNQIVNAVVFTINNLEEADLKQKNG
jgi:hypothetical protein